MPAHDVQYVLDHAVEFCQIGGDTYHFMMELCPNPNAIADLCEERERNRPMEELYHSLQDTGEFYENYLIDFRKHAERTEAMQASFIGLRAAPRLIKNLADHMSSRLVDEKFTTLTRDAIAEGDRTGAFSRRVDVIRRSLQRARSDFSQFGVGDVHDIGRLTDRRSHDQFMARRQAIADIKARFQIENPEVAVHIPFNSRDPLRDARRAAQEIRERQEQDRKIIKRSFKMFTKLFGGDMTRMFVRGENIRIEGQYAIYEFRRMSSLTDSHGGSRALSVFHKDHPDILLCDVCIYTKDVPLLDHIASLILHIKGGLEEDILSIGNPHPTTDGRNHPVLGQYMPAPIEFNEFTIPSHYKNQITNRRAKEQAMKRDIVRYLCESVDTETARLLRAVKSYETVQLPNHYTVSEFMYPELQNIPLPVLELEADEAWVD